MPLETVTYGEHSFQVFVIPTLALPAYNSWHLWAPAYLDDVAEKVARKLAGR